MSRRCTGSGGCARLLLALALLALAGCGSLHGLRFEPGADGPAWPGPPDPARVRFLGAFGRPGDFGDPRSWLDNVWDFVSGVNEDRSWAMRPYGLALDDQERLYVADSAQHAIHRFDLRQGPYERIVPQGSANRLDTPTGLALAPDGRLFVSDSGRGQILILAAGGKPVLGRITDAALLRPAGLAVDALAGRLYVADPLAHCVHIFDLNGARLGTLGQRGPKTGQFNYPTNLWVNPQGDLYVVDTLNFRVQRFTRAGRFLGQFGRLGDRPGDFAKPKGIAGDSEGHIYVVEGYFDVIEVFEPGGRLLLVFGGTGRDRGQFWLPTGILIDARDRIFVADAYNQRVQVFQYLREGGS